MDKENVILIDAPTSGEWDFLKILTSEKEHWKAISKTTNLLHGSKSKNLLRLIWYFWFPLKIVYQRHKLGKIIAWQQFFGLNYAFWCRLLHLKKVNELTVMTFIYKRKRGKLGKLYHQYMRYIVTSKYIDRFICFAKEEPSYYAALFGVNKNRFIFVPLGIKTFIVPKVSDNGYIFATGRSNRNYDFLVECMRNTTYKVIIACDGYQYEEVPENVEILNNCYREEMRKRMATCHVVAIPLEDLRMSSGQLVILQAMSLGKPVVCTASDGVKDYVRNEETGLLVNNNKDEWHAAINRLYSEKEEYKRLSANAKKYFDEYYTELAMFKRIKDIHYCPRKSFNNYRQSQ